MFVTSLTAVGHGVVLCVWLVRRTYGFFSSRNQFFRRDTDLSSSDESRKNLRKFRCYYPHRSTHLVLMLVLMLVLLLFFCVGVGFCDGGSVGVGVSVGAVFL